MSPGLVLQSVLLFQHHQTTTPFSPSVPVATAAVANENNEKENDNGEEHQ